MAADFDCDVLVVGLGPVGAVLTALLAQRGVGAIAIDSDIDVYPMPRAVHFDHEIMRLFQQLGIADEVLRHSRELPDYEFRTADGQVLMKLSPPAQTPSGWSGGYMFHQPGLERALRDLLDGLPNAEVRLAWRLDTLVQDRDGVTASVAGPDGPATIRSRYLVGCDGAWSSVREAIGGDLFDYQFDEPWLVFDARLSAGSRVPDRNLQLCDPGRPTTCVMSGPGRHRWEFMLLPGETSEAMLTDGSIQALLAPWDCGQVEIERKAVYRFHGLVASRWRDRRVLIAGDAAHQTPPFVGQGMCSGLRDAANLAWKLETVLSGAAGDGLLDTYQQEREPHVRAAIELAIGMGRMVCTLDRDIAAKRDVEMLARQKAGAPPSPPPGSLPFAAGCLLTGAPSAGTIFPQPTGGNGSVTERLDDSLGLTGWLISRTPASAGGRLSAYCLEDEALAAFRPALIAWFDRQGVEAVLVRPDRYVFGAGNAETLLSAWAQTMHSPRQAA